MSAEDLETCLREQAQAGVGGQDLPLEEILVKRGHIRPEDLIRLLREKARRSRGIPDIPGYDVQKIVGQGATAIVHRAWDRDLRRPVAIKILRESPGLSDMARQRFRREAQVAAGLSHPNVVTVFDAGEANGQLYLVMELVEGRSLDEILKEQKTSQNELLGLLEKAARGVAAAHSKGIIHRDLKPANLLVMPPGELKVGDFGLAHLVDSSTELTKTGATLGTPLYMSPEQVSGRTKEISPATDVYALGAILYEILTGRPPHRGDTMMEIYAKIAREEPLAPRKLLPKVSPDLETIALKALEKEPGKRYPTAGAFADDLRHALDGDPIQARPVSGPGKLWRKAVRYRAILLPLASAILLGLAGLFAGRKISLTGKPIFLERLQGDIQTIREGKTFPVSQGQVLGAGQGVVTGPPPSLGLLRFEDGSRVEIGPETALTEIRIDSGKRLFLSKGTIRAEVATPLQDPLVVATPSGEVTGAGRSLRVGVDSDPKKGMRLEVEDGRVELRDLSGKSTLVESGQCAVTAGGAAPVVHPLDLRLDLGGGVGMELVYIKPGAFSMGGTQAPQHEFDSDERPEHKVAITKGCYLGRYLVTRGQFAAFVNATGYKTEAEVEGHAYGKAAEGKWQIIAGNNWRRPGIFSQTDEHPVTCISWNDAKSFCEWVAKKTGRAVGLPSEAEWEYACRAGTKTRWAYGDDERAMDEYEWNWENSGQQTHPVGQKKPNAWGLYDMQGNAWEWCQDWAGPYASDAVDPMGPPRGTRRCVRGGSWLINTSGCRAAYRRTQLPSERTADMGFRVKCEPTSRPGG